jgi:hypothetical protein
MPRMFLLSTLTKSQNFPTFRLDTGPIVCHDLPMDELTLCDNCHQDYLDEDGECDYCLGVYDDVTEPPLDFGYEHDSAMASAGWGTDEDYGYYGDDYDY